MNKPLGQMIREQINECPTLDVESINAEFVTPFSGLEEMYALSKGVEIGAELENHRLKDLIERLVTVIEKQDETLAFYQGLDWKDNTDTWQAPARQTRADVIKMLGGGE